MAWDAVPWFVGGGAQHSPEVARLLAYAATNGTEGIVTPGDLKVEATAVPGGTVNVQPGDCLIRNRAQGGDSQTYVGRLATRDTVSIAATSGTSRSDLIVAQIEDPFMAGEPWQEPEDPTAGPYVFTRVIPNVPAWATRLQDVTGFEGRSAIALARVDIPASTGTITGDMITDLRKMALPRNHREVQMEQVHPINQDLSTNSGEDFVQYPNTEPYFYVPEWATRAFVNFTISGLAVVGGHIEGWSRLAWGTLGGPNTMYGDRLWYDYDSPTPDPVLQAVSRNDLHVIGIFDIPESERGGMHVLRMQCTKSAGPGLLRVHNGTQASIDIQFYENPT